MRKTISVILALVLALPLVACGREIVNNNEGHNASVTSYKDRDWNQPEFTTKISVGRITFYTPSNWRYEEKTGDCTYRYYYPYSENDAGMLYIYSEPLEEITEKVIEDATLSRDYLDTFMDAVCDENAAKETKYFSICGYPAVEFLFTQVLSEKNMEARFFVVLTPELAFGGAVTGGTDKINDNFEDAYEEFLNMITITGMGKETDSTTSPKENEETTPATTEGKKDNSSIDPDFKAAMDSYEQFFDEYVAIMKKYKENPMDMSVLADYTKYMGQYADMMQKFEKWESEDLNAAETAYYIDVQARITKKLLEVAY